MQNMSKEFYDYLAQRTLYFFDNVEVTRVNKFIIKLDNLEDVSNYFEAINSMLVCKNRANTFNYIDAFSNELFSTTSFVRTDGTEIIVVPEINIQPAFMTRLRNIDLDNKVLYFVCHNPIDSIVGGMEDLQKEGLPFNKNTVLKDIKSRLSNSGMKSAEQAILRFALENQNKKDIFDDYSLHDFENVLSVIYRGHIEAGDFRNFGLFADMEFINTILISSNNFERIEDNYKYFQSINDSVKLGDLESDLEGKYRDSFIKKIRKNINCSGSDEWDNDISYEEIKREQENAQRNKDRFEYRDTTVRRNGGDLISNNEYFVRSDSEKGVKKKKLNLLILNDKEEQNIFDICVSFTSSAKKESIAQNFGCNKAIFEGRNLLIRIESEEVSFAKVKLIKEYGYEIKICIINCVPDYFTEYRSSFYIKPNKKLEKSYLEIVSEDIPLVFNRKAGEDDSDIILSTTLRNDMHIAYSSDTTLILDADEDTFSDINKVCFWLKLVNKELPIIFNCSLSQNVSISGAKIEQMKLTKKQSFLFFDNRLTFGTDSYNAKEDLREALQVEAFMIKSNSMSCKVYDAESGNIDDLPIEVPDNIQDAYKQLVSYYAQRNTLPSLAFYDKELIDLASKYVNEVINEFQNINSGDSINKQTENILRIGTVYYDSAIAFSSLHPMNIAHQLLLAKEEVGDEISEDIVKKINADNLVPFIRNDDAQTYLCVTQEKVPQWTYYYPKDEPKFNGKMGYVPRLIKEKIINFNNHFPYLFGNLGNNKIIINSVNFGDCENLFRGIVEYYKSTFGDDSMYIDVYVYGDINTKTVFEYMSDKALLKNFLSLCGIKENSKKYSDLEFANYLLEHLKYYKKSLQDSKYHYCHLAFIQMDQKEQEAISNRDNVFSGLLLDGLIAGSTSMSYGDEKATNSGKYRTGYGSKFNVHDSITIKLANYYNDLMLVFCKSGNPYTPTNCICTYITDGTSEVLDKTYDSSNWVVFIDPKVDLHYFKNEQNKDVMIIHYSDQKSTSNGFDAITVTKKTHQYQSVLKDFFDTQEESFQSYYLNFDDEAIRSVIDMFNAINGEWLLKLMSKDNGFRKEKISILSASKFMMSLLSSKEIVWVPISMEEIIRVSGAVGLSQKEGLFSAKSLGANGAASDDLLMFGIEFTNTGSIKVHMIPVEVKIGYASSNPIEKAKLQVKATSKLINEYLSYNSENPLMAKFYRNFFAQLAISSADKIDLYGIMNIQDYEKIIKSDVRGKLLNDEFEISTAFSQTIGNGVVIVFKDDIFLRDIHSEDNVTIIKLLGADCYKALAETKADSFLSWFYSIPQMRAFQNKIYPDNSSLSQVFSLNAETDTNMHDTAEDVPASKNQEAREVSAENITASLNPSHNVSKKNPDGMKVLFGTDVNTHADLFWYPNDTERIMHPNTGIIGTMGTGKTQFTKSLIYQLVRQQGNNVSDKPLGILIFDYKGDYNKNKKDFVDATNAKVYELYHLPFNPFSIPVNGTLRPALPLHIASTFRETIAKAYNLGNIQVDVLKECIMTAYSNRGIHKNDRSSWNLLAPTLAEVYQVYCESDSFKRDSLNAALSELIDFEIFEPDASKVMPLFDFIDGVTVIDLSGYDSSVQNLIVAITLDLFYSQMLANGHSQIEGKLRQLTKFILVDEADNFLKVGFSSIRKILKEGREFGVGTILSTQFLTHFYTSDDDYSKYIFSWIVHNVADLTTKDIKNLFNTTSKNQEEELYSAIKKLQKHHSFVKFGDSSKPICIKDRAFWEILRDEK